MEINKILESVRKKHIDIFSSILTKVRSEEPNICSELLADNNENELSPVVRIDYVVENGEELTPFVIATSAERVIEFDDFSMTYETDNGISGIVEVSPFGWDLCAIRGSYDKEILVKNLQEWINYWIWSENDSVDEKEIQCRAHSIEFTEDEQTGEEYLLVDFGTAEVEAFHELMVSLIESGMEDIQVFC